MCEPPFFFALAKREKLDGMFAAAVAATRKAAAKGGRPSKEKPTQKIVEVNRSKNETDHKLAESVGTNRTTGLLPDSISVGTEKP
jgi:hypothetical protein